METYLLNRLSPQRRRFFPQDRGFWTHGHDIYLRLALRGPMNWHTI